MISDLIFPFQSFWRTRLKPLFQRSKHERKVKNWLSSLPELSVCKPGNQHLLIIRPDDIGDYILFRPALERIRKHPAYKGWKITVLGNQVWKELALELDGDFADNWIWLNKKPWFEDAGYRNTFLDKLENESPSVVWIPARTRHFFLEDSLASAFSGIPVFTSGHDFCHYPTVEEKRFVEKLRYQILHVSPKNIHELEFNRSTTDLFLGEKNRDSVESTESAFLPDGTAFQMELPAESYLIFFPGASAGSKRWPPSHFAALADLLQPSGIRIILAGAPSDKEFAQTIISETRFPETILNLTGKTSLPQLLFLIKNARLLVSNDTSAAHMAAMFQTPLVALCNGNKFGRFFPYPSGFRHVSGLHPVNGIPFHFEDRYPIKRISAQRAAQACFSLLK